MMGFGVVITDVNGTQQFTTSNPGYVASADIGTKSDLAVTDPTLSASEIALLKGILKQLQGNGTGSAPADIIDRAARLLGKISADDGAITAMGAKADAAVTDPTLTASQIALLKGLLKQLQGNGSGATPVSLTGNLAPLTGSAPTLIDTIPYSTFTANSTIYRMYNGVLTRNARSRNILVLGNLNQPFSTSAVLTWRDSTLAVSNATWGQGALLNSNNGVGFSWQTNVAGYQCFVLYGQFGQQTAASVDSLTIQFQVGSTAPTSGNVYVYVQEVH